MDKLTKNVSGMLMLIALALQTPVLTAQPRAGALVTEGYDKPLSLAFILPAMVNETSGLVYHAGGFWTFNDSGGEPELYKMDPDDGSLLQTVILTGADNRDWEDISQDEEYFYVGDFGNNRGNRKDLKVYKVAKATIAGQPIVRVPAEVIAFRYADQEVFDKRDRNHDFDCESLISLNDELLLFSKNWVSGRTRMYRLPKEPGSHVIAPAGEFDAGGLVTAADYCRKTKTLALLGYTNQVPFMILFQPFDGSSLSPEEARRINFPGMAGAQTEGICFVNEKQVAISAENTRKYDQAVYLLPLADLEKHNKDKSR